MEKMFKILTQEMVKTGSNSPKSDFFSEEIFYLNSWPNPFMNQKSALQMQDSPSSQLDTQSLAAFALEIERCRQCESLCHARWRNRHDYQGLMGELKQRPKLMFILDHPRGEMTQDGNPLGGESGILLGKMIAAMKLQREQYVVTLLAKCSPAQVENYASLKSNCNHFLQQELELFRPELIVLFGAQALEVVLGEGKRLVEEHGRVHSFHFKNQKVEFTSKVIPVFHPEYLLINPSMKKVVWEDLQKVIKLVGRA